MRFLDFCLQTARRATFALAFLIASLVFAQPADDKNYLHLTFGIVGSAKSETTTLSFDDRLQGKVEVTPTRNSDGEITWFPKGDSMPLTGRIDQRQWRTTILKGEGGVQAVQKEETTYTAGINLPATIGNAMITVRPAQKNYDFQFMIITDMAAAMHAVDYLYTSKTEGAGSVGGGTARRKEGKMPIDAGPSEFGLNVGYFMLPVAAPGMPLPAAKGALVGRTSVPIPRPSNWKGDWNIAIEAQWRIGTALPPVELEVDIADYATWRPEGSLTDAAKPGNRLVARATLKPKGPGADLLPEVKSIRFELSDTSSEPGVCLNWPLQAEDRDPDLRLAPAPGEREGELGERGQAYTVESPNRDERGHPSAVAHLESFDFGGRATLRVVAKLDDDTELEGVLKAEGPPQTRILLPKRADNDWIAESWRKEKNVAQAAADDDAEKVEGQPHNGDGFTLYEEYRGWREAGRRLEGDPGKKDFFILNERGADARGGIALFERISKLRVHAKLREGEEMGEEAARCMNANRRDAPQVVRQHGVVILGGNGFAGAVTAGVEGAPPQNAFRPKFVRWIILEPSEAGRGELAFSVAKGLDAGLNQRDAEFAWDRAIAHELLHSVGVDHHGEGLRTRIPLYFQGAGSPINPTGKPRLVYEGPAPTWEWYVPNSTKFGAELFSEDRGPTVTVLWEDTKKPIFEDLLPAYEATLAKVGPGFSDEAYAEVATKLAYTGKSAAYWNQLSLHELAAGWMGLPKPLTIGEDGGTDSGNELCVMRYYFANGYRKKGDKDSYFMIRPGQNKIGRDICRSPAGTGGNAPGHDPQSRFGNAAAGRGDCFSQICPNDNVPPRRTN
jgi:hypothetical protein